MPVLLQNAMARRKRSYITRFPPTKATDRPVEPTSTQVSVTIERSVHFDHVCEDIAEAEGDEGTKVHGSSEEGIERDMA